MSRPIGPEIGTPPGAPQCTVHRAWPEFLRLPWRRCNDNVRRVFLLADVSVIDVVVVDGGLLICNRLPGWRHVVVHPDRMYVPFLMDDVCVDSQDVSRALVWLSACGWLAHAINRQTLICDVSDAGPSCIIHDDYVDSRAIRL